MTSGHLISKKGTELLFYMAIARHTNESVDTHYICLCDVIGNLLDLRKTAIKLLLIV